jgi:hypothetical protein
MAKRPEQAIQDTKKDLLLIEKELLSYSNTREELNKQLKSARAKLRRKQSDTYPNKFVKELVKIAKEQAKTALILRIDEAVTMSPEFLHESYIKALYKVANDSSTYKIIPVGSGWRTSLSVQILFESKAGRLQDYARGITLYREKIKTKISDDDESNRGEKATRHWFGKIYGSDRQRIAIEERIKFSSKTAPFWQILDSGDVEGGVNMSSNRPDGSYNPIPHPRTAFLENARQDISTSVKRTLSEEEGAWKRESSELQEIIDEIITERDTATNSIRQLRPEAALNREIFRKLGKVSKYVSEKTVQKAVKKYRAGEEFENINIAARGSGKKIYLTTRLVEGSLE